MNRTIAIASIAAAAFAAAAHADFFIDNVVGVSGTAGPEFGGTTWGTNAGQGVHLLGTASNYYDSVFGTGLPVIVTSTVNDLHSVSFSIDYSHFFPGDFSFLTVDIVGLKQDGTLLEVVSSVGSATTDGNNVHWKGTGADFAADGKLFLTVRQSPAPGALALLGLAGLAGSRRRRA